MDNVKFVLRYCIKNARRGERINSVFDLMYEGIEYTSLKSALATLEERGEIEIIDIKTFKFVGEIRNLELEKILDPPTLEEQDLFVPDSIDDLYVRALEYVVQNNNASASFIQRRCGTGYLKACRILDWMESQGYISPPNGPFERKVLMTKDEFKAKFNPSAFNNLYDDDDDDDDDYEEDPFEALEQYSVQRMEHLREHEKKLKAESQTPADYIREIRKKVEAAPLEAIPEHPSWNDEFEFIRTVRQTKEQIIKSDKKMGVKGAIKKAEASLDDVRGRGDEKLAEVYERVIFELDRTSQYEYAKLKRKYFQ